MGDTIKFTVDKDSFVSYIKSASIITGKGRAKKSKIFDYLTIELIPTKSGAIMRARQIDPAKIIAVYSVSMPTLFIEPPDIKEPITFAFKIEDLLGMIYSLPKTAGALLVELDNNKIKVSTGDMRFTIPQEAVDESNIFDVDIDMVSNILFPASMPPFAGFKVLDIPEVKLELMQFSIKKKGENPLLYVKYYEHNKEFEVRVSPGDVITFKNLLENGYQPQDKAKEEFIDRYEELWKKDEFTYRVNVEKRYVETMLKAPHSALWLMFPVKVENDEPIPMPIQVNAVSDAFMTLYMVSPRIEES